MAELAEMFVPLSPEECADTPNAGAGESEKRPIVPVPEDAPPMRFRHPQHGAPTRAWPYYTVAGGLVGYICRWDFATCDGARDKLILPVTFCDLGDGRRAWRAAGFPEPRPLFRLPEIVAAPDVPVLVVEGEKTQEAAAQLFPDVLVTTPPHGARSPHKADWSPLKGRLVIVWPDHDQAGVEYAQAVQRLAGAVAAEVRVVRVPDGFPPKWDLADPLPDGWTPQRLRALLDAALSAERTVDANPDGEDTTRRDGVSLPFRLTKTAVEYRDEDEWYFVCSRLEVAAVTRSASGEEWGRLLRLTDRDGCMHEWAMPMEMLAGGGEEYRRRLLSLGLEIAPGRSARDRLHQYISTCRPSQRARCVSRIGWHGPVFVLPDATVGETEDERTLLQTVGSFDHAFREQATLAAWQQQVARFASGNSRLVLAISAAFAAPLLHVVGAESGGFHLRGASSIGKTTALVVGASVWGPGSIPGYVRQWRATDNGLEAVAQAHCDTLLCLDELSQIDAKAAGAAAYMLANGAGKTRAGRGGDGRTPAAWRLLFLSSGEISIADKVAEDGRGRKLAAGQQVRVIDIPADAGAGFGLFEDLHGFESADAFARHFKQAAGKYYGTAGPAFLAEVTGQLDGVREPIAGFKAEFVKEHCPAGADGQVSRVVARFALVAAAGELATALGIVPWAPGEAIRAAAACLWAWLEARGGIQPAEVTAGIAQVRQFIERHGEARFAPWGGDDGDRPTINRAGFRKPGADGSVEYYVLPEVWRSEVCAGFDPGMLARVLAERGLLIPDRDGKPQSRHRLPGSHGPVRCYRLAASVLGSDDHA